MKPRAAHTVCLWLALTATAVAVAAAPEVTVSGAGNVGVGQMSGGTIQMGMTAQEAKALAAATGQGLVTQLTAIVQRLNAQQGSKAKEQDFSFGVVQGFLATIKGKQVPQSDWPVVFGELTRQYLELGVRIQATPVTSNKIKDLVSRADSARKLGNLDQADVLLADASEFAIQDAQGQQRQARESTRQAASLLASRASLAFARLERAQGAEFLERGFELRKDDLEPTTFWWLIEAGDAWRTTGQSVRALRVYTKARDAASSKLGSETGDTEWQRDLSVGHIKVGDTQQAQGDLGSALRSYQAGMAIHRKLAAADPGNTEWQRDLSISHERVGNTQQAQGDLGSALKSYQAGMAIRQKLAAADPGNTEWQRDLSVGHSKVGDTLLAQGDWGNALRSYQAAMAICQKLAAADPGNTEWQRDLSVSHDRVGNTQRAQGDLGSALRSYHAGMAIAQKLAAADPGNTEWQRDLVVSYWKLSQIGAAAGSINDRRAFLEQGLAILNTQRRQDQLPASNLGWINAFEDAIAELR